MAQEHIESLEQQLADAEKKACDANQKGIYFYYIRLSENLLPPEAPIITYLQTLSALSHNALQYC